MARAGSARRVSAGAALAAVLVLCAWFALREPALVQSPVVSAPSPATAPEHVAPTSTLQAAWVEARGAYLAAVSRQPGGGVSSREVAQERGRVFEREVAALAALGPAAVPELQSQLTVERNDHARLLLLSALSHVEGEAGVRGTLAALEGLGDPTLEQLFLDRLVRRDDPASLVLLEAVLRRSPRPETRVALLASAARRGDARLAGALPELALHDESAAVRAAALASAQRLGTPLAAPLLEQMAHADPDPALREQALAALAQSDPQAFVGDVRRTLRAGVPEAGQLAAITRALGRSDAPEAGALLEELASSPDLAVRRAAAEALRARGARNLAR